MSIQSPALLAHLINWSINHNSGLTPYQIKNAESGMSRVELDRYAHNLFKDKGVSQDVLDNAIEQVWLAWGRIDANRKVVGKATFYQKRPIIVSNPDF